MLTLKKLLAKGYFPKELPPAFSTVSFAAAACGHNGGVVSQLSGGGANSAEVCVHNMIRSGGLRRHLGIPNPVHYSRLCSFVAQNWSQLQQAASRSPFSLTKPVDTGSSRAIAAAHDFKERTEQRIRLRSFGRVILRADVNRFYPSIYTHSVPWAIEGKALVKQAKATGSLNTVWSNNLDFHARNMNDQQTVGIPIGPDTSLLLAECLLAAVDVQLALEIPGLRGIRFIDDYEFVMNHRSEAELVVSTLQNILSKYELALNPEKTQIIELPFPIEPLWKTRLQAFSFRVGNVNMQHTDLIAYFDTVFSLAEEDPDENVFKYAIPRLSSINLERSNWPIAQSLLCQCARVEPACLSQVCDQILHFRQNGWQIDVGQWKECLEQIILERLPLGQASGALWALWIMKQLGISMSPVVEGAVDDCDDSAVALMALGMANTGLGNPATFNRLHSFADPSELFGRHWLLCYEINKQGWLTPPSGINAFSAHPQFEFMKSQNVSFFNINAPALSPRRRSPRHESEDGGGY